MRWPSIDDLSARAPLPGGYHYEYLGRQEVAPLIAALKAWYPGIAVGTASCHLREAFYADKFCLDGSLDRDFVVVLLKKGSELAGMLSVERDPDSEVLYGRLGAISSRHRGARLSRKIPLLIEALGRAMGAGMVYGLATMTHRYMQATFEHVGWHLSGIMSGFDKELVAVGDVRRVYEAVYLKVLAPEQLLPPRAQDMTPAVRALFDRLYPARSVTRAPAMA